MRRLLKQDNFAEINPDTTVGVIRRVAQEKEIQGSAYEEEIKKTVNSVAENFQILKLVQAAKGSRILAAYGITADAAPELFQQAQQRIAEVLYELKEAGELPKSFEEIDTEGALGGIVEELTQESDGEA